MESATFEPAPLLTLSLIPCGPVLPNFDQNSKFARKPPCSPPRSAKPAQDPPKFYPSPTKRRSDNKENLSLDKNSNEQKLFENSSNFNPRAPKTNYASTRLKKVSKATTKNPTNYSFTQFSPQLKTSSKKQLNFSSYLSPYKKNSSVESKKIRVYTPVLSEKNRKSPEIQEFCQKISLFDSKTSKSLISADTCSTFKDQSTRIEDSTTMGEITPIKQEDVLRDEINEFSFNSPVNTIKILNSPEEAVFTPEGNKISTPDMKKLVGNEFLAPRKGNIEFFTPDSNVFVLSSSSEVISEASFCDGVQTSFGDISLVPELKGIDKQMQTDEDLKKVLELLGDRDVIEGLKIIGKFKEVFRIINS